MVSRRGSRYVSCHASLAISLNDLTILRRSFTVSSHLTIDAPFVDTIRSFPPKLLNQHRILHPAHVVVPKARASTNPDCQSTIRWVCSIATHPFYGTQLLQPLDVQCASLPSSSGVPFQLQSRARHKISLTMNIQRCNLKVRDPSRR